METDEENRKQLEEAFELSLQSWVLIVSSNSDLTDLEDEIEPSKKSQLEAQHRIVNSSIEYSKSLAFGLLQKYVETRLAISMLDLITSDDRYVWCCVCCVLCVCVVCVCMFYFYNFFLFFFPFREEPDHVQYEEQLSCVSYLGRLTPTLSLSFLISALEMGIKSIQTSTGKNKNRKMRKIIITLILMEEIIMIRNHQQRKILIIIILIKKTIMKKKKMKKIIIKI